ncbi:MAG: CpaD family pilus assembly protein [Alphaproteobacteria bacterium]|jgi:pilus assembly protein CpaD|uniref:CpaD family pilus assembly protein n=1 Tax=Rhizobium sp. R86522 TaxID=3093861 RepID=UPI002615E35E|nr:CpaD family pilus assembly protein [Alphaproteobacteria bacterium]MBU0835632.1 CpaD family pilus assembly protein [Alphaproteobacteria bacterium]MBU1764986.1 CpaD family pilus assembly protein [Alphaproteobacteria bacterium]MDM7981518.1 CpaD family pilus assembly protein [Rhizobium sp.]MDM8014187.1 CpaD family pilus assembly protein [Rhizobium sp.]
MALVGHSFQRILLAGLVLGTAVALSGCGSTKDRMTTSAIPDDYRTRHPIMLSEVEHTLDVPIASGDRRLTVGVQDSIAGFAADYLSASTGTIQVMVPHGSPNSGAASAMRKQIRQVLTTRGVAANKIIETSYQAEANSNAAPVRISYVAITAMTNPCGEWPEDLQNNTFSNKNYHNFGCATQSNLAAQIANPMDLVTPRDMAPIDATRRSTVIGLYRRGADTSTN